MVGVGGGGAGAAASGAGGAGATGAEGALAAPPRLRKIYHKNVEFLYIRIVVTCTHDEEFSSRLNSSPITDAQLSNDSTARGFDRDRCFVRFNVAYFFVFLDSITNSYRKHNKKILMTIIIISIGAKNQD